MFRVLLSLGAVTLGAGAPLVSPIAPLQTAAAAVGRPMEARMQSLPPVWIGVRMAPIPAPLAAHLNREGLMVDNVVADSPADRAGLQRYDVVVSFADRPVKTGDDLVDAIAASGPDKAASMLIVRGGQEQTLVITPVSRSAEPTVAFKYDEPAPVAEDEALHYFGHTLRMGPDGQLEFQPLGRMKDLPPWIDEHLWRGDLDVRMWAPNDADSFGWPLGKGFTFRQDALDAPDGHFELSVRLSEDGKSLAIERGKDGRFTVTREENGVAKSATYESEEQFQKQDAEGYEQYRRHVRTPNGMIVVPPAIDQLPHLQQDFDEQLRDIQQRVQEALEKARESRRSLKPDAKSNAAIAHSSDSESLSIRITPESCVVEIDENGKPQRYVFESVDDLRQRDPALYERIKPYIEDLEHEARSQSGFSFATAA